MKLPLSWIKEFIDLEKGPKELAHILTMAGLEVDSVEDAALSYRGIFVAEVIETKPHPNAEKLCIATVNDGNDNYQVVCGAPNCRPGLRTAFAPIGAKLCLNKDKPFTIKKSKIRDIESFGMLCSKEELQLAKKSDGIVEFSDEYPIGKDLKDIFGDIIFEISLTPNLGHCTSVLGIAREIAAATKKPVSPPDTSLIEDLEEDIHAITNVTIESKEFCSRYSCRVVKGVTIGPSPLWLQQRLSHSGIRSINNIVDITNLVLLEFGHPLHAFDYDKLEGHKVIIKTAVKGDTFTTLDGEEHTLDEDKLLICDEEKAIALAGVMGGLNSEVTDLTKNVLIESAYFDPNNIRRTSKHLNLSTESSRRFERGTDYHNVIRALNRAAKLMQELGGGKIAKGVIDIKKSNFEERIVSCRLNRINKVLGTKLAISEVEDIFSRLDFHFTYDTKDTFSVKIPSYRNDISLEIDLIEEVARIHGFNHIEPLPCSYRTSPLPNSPIYLFENEIRRRLLREGLQEFLCCDLISPSQVDIVSDKPFPKGSIVSILNPTSIEQSILRPSLLPGFLQIAKNNAAQQNHDIFGFEIGRIHFKDGEQYREQTMTALLLTGKRHPYQWDNKPQEMDFFDAKGIIENLFTSLGITNALYRPSSIENFHPGRQASITVEGQEVGIIGELVPSLTRRYDIKHRFVFVEINLHDIIAFRKESTKMQALAQFPGSERDWTLTLKEEATLDSILNVIKGIPSKILQKVLLRDIYRSDRLGTNAKNITLRFEYRNEKKTISQETVDREHSRITENVINKLGDHVLKHDTMT